MAIPMQSGNIRDYLGRFIGQKVIDITRDDENEAGDAYVCLLFEDGNWIKFFAVDADLYQNGCFAICVPEDELPPEIR